MKNIIFVAAPAAGKGTFSDMLQDKYGYVHISTGDLLRKAKNEDSELGKEIASLMNSGSLVPDEIVLELLSNYIKEIGTSKKFILDGVPRNVNQIEAVLNIVGDDYVVVFLDVDYDKAMKRTLGRLTCPKCNKGYNKYSLEFRPKVDGICDNCGIELVARSDDNEETFKIRFDTYMNETREVLDYFKKINRLATIKVTDIAADDIKEIERVIE